MWNERYAEEGFAYGLEPNDFLVSNIAHLPKGKVACLCAGEGRNAIYLAGRGFEVTALDQSVVGLNKAKAWAEKEGLTIATETVDLGEVELGETRFDGVISIFCHVPAEMRRAVHRKVVSALKPGGVVILEAYTPKQVGRGTGGPPTDALAMTAEGLRNELEGLEILHLEELDRPVVEGKYHTGDASVVQLVGRKR